MKKKLNNTHLTLMYVSLALNLPVKQSKYQITANGAEIMVDTTPDELC